MLLTETFYERLHEDQGLPHPRRTIRSPAAGSRYTGRQLLIKILLSALFGAIFGTAASFAAFTYFLRSGFEIRDRGILHYGVPFVRSGSRYGENQPTALDVGPRSSPKDEANSGIAWTDICNADLIANAKAPVTRIYSGAWSDKAMFGTRSFKGAPEVPLKLRIGNSIVGELNKSGLVIYGSVTADRFVESGNKGYYVDEPLHVLTRTSA